MAFDSKIALFIDGANLYATAKALGFDIDYSSCSRNSRAADYCCARTTTPYWSKSRNTRPSVR
jgi:uncharacterized LabA/DUF88 family protein